MQETSALHKALLRDPEHWKEHKAVIAGTEYRKGEIVSLSTSGGMFSAPEIGRCASRQVDLVLRPPAAAIPRRAEIRLYTRLVTETQAAEWLPKGVFFLSTRRRDSLTGNLTIHGYDAMRKAGGIWLTEEYSYDNWPMSQREAAEDIAARMGVTLDPRTILSDAFPVDYPVDGSGELTMQDVLEGISAANAGNWVISDRGQLLLLRYGDIPPETWYLVEGWGDAITFGGDRILVR